MYYDILPLLLKRYVNANVIWDVKTPIITKRYTHKIILQHNDTYLFWSLDFDILNPNFYQLNQVHKYNSLDIAMKQISNNVMPIFDTTFHNHDTIDQYIGQKHNISSIEIINCLKFIEDEMLRYQMQIHLEDIMNQWNIKTPPIFHNNEILPTCSYNDIDSLVTTLRQEKLFSLLFV